MTYDTIVTQNVIEYCGNAEDRAIIREHEWWFSGDKHHSMPRFNVLLTSYELLNRELVHFRVCCAVLHTLLEATGNAPALLAAVAAVTTLQNTLQGFKWQTVVVDEAHRLKSTTAQIRESIAALDIHWLLLMTGTPVQNNVRELFSLLNLLNPVAFADEGEFMERFGDGSDPACMDDLRAVMKPYMLRRTKAMVEQLPDKEEIIVGVRWQGLLVVVRMVNHRRR